MEFARAAREELGDALGDEHVERMFDAFDPSLRRQIFMEMLMGHTVGKKNAIVSGIILLTSTK